MPSYLLVSVTLVVQQPSGPALVCLVADLVGAGFGVCGDDAKVGLLPSSVSVFDAPVPADVQELVAKTAPVIKVTAFTKATVAGWLSRLAGLSVADGRWGLKPGEVFIAQEFRAWRSS